MINLEEPNETSEEYDTAKVLCGHKVELKLYDNRPCTTDYMARVKIIIDGKEYGWEYAIDSFSEISIGNAIDLSIKGLMQKLKKNGIMK